MFLARQPWLMLTVIVLVYLLSFLFFADSVGGKTDIQCRFPAILPPDQVFDICCFHCYFDCLDSISSYDRAGYICVLSGILAHRLGDTTGTSFSLAISSFLLLILYKLYCSTTLATALLCIV